MTWGELCIGHICHRIFLVTIVIIVIVGYFVSLGLLGGYYTFT